MKPYTALVITPFELPEIKFMAVYYIYMVVCSDASLYTGYTDNLPRRIAAHNGKIKILIHIDLEVLNMSSCSGCSTSGSCDSSSCSSGGCSSCGSAPQKTQAQQLSNIKNVIGFPYTAFPTHYDNDIFNIAQLLRLSFLRCRTAGGAASGRKVFWTAISPAPAFPNSSVCTAILK